MPREIEVKVPCPDLDAVRQRLLAFGAVTSADGLERNIVFDTPDHSLRAADSLLRLRRYGESVLTFKGPRASSSDAVKSREEIEFEVSDFDAASDVLARLGFHRVWAYEKRREKYLLADAVVCLDTVPALGSFVEIEAPDAAIVKLTLEKLGLSMENATPLTYLELFIKCCGTSGRTLPDMVFDDEETK